MEERIETPPWKTEQEAIDWFLGGRSHTAPRAKHAKDGTYDPYPAEVKLWDRKDGSGDNAKGDRAKRSAELESEVSAPAQTFLSVRELENARKRSPSLDEALTKNPVTEETMIDFDQSIKEQSDVIQNKLYALVELLETSAFGQPYGRGYFCLLYTSPSPRDQRGSRMPSSA